MIEVFLAFTISKQKIQLTENEQIGPTPTGSWRFLVVRLLVKPYESLVNENLDDFESKSSL